MKKLITILLAIVLVGCMAVLFTGCGAKDEELTTSPTLTTVTTTNPTMNDGMVTDESVRGDNGVIGDIVTDISEGISDAVTDVSEDVSDMMQ